MKSNEIPTFSSSSLLFIWGKILHICAIEHEQSIKSNVSNRIIIEYHWIDNKRDNNLLRKFIVFNQRNQEK